MRCQDCWQSVSLTLYCHTTAVIADSAVNCTWPAIFIAVPRTGDEVRRPKMNAIWLRVSSNAFDLLALLLRACARYNNLQSNATMAWLSGLQKSPSEEVFAELVAEILCA